MLADAGPWLMRRRERRRAALSNARTAEPAKACREWRAVSGGSKMPHLNEKTAYPVFCWITSL